MRYRTRLVLLVTGLLAGAVVIISSILAWSTRSALLASAEDSLAIGAPATRREV